MSAANVNDQVLMKARHVTQLWTHTDTYHLTTFTHSHNDNSWIYLHTSFVCTIDQKWAYICPFS